MRENILPRSFTLNFSYAYMHMHTFALTLILMHMVICIVSHHNSHTHRHVALTPGCIAARNCACVPFALLPMCGTLHN